MNKVTLYGKDKSGKFKQWSIWTVEDSLFIEHGQEGGKRSADLQKYKEFLDEEFEIVAVGKDKQDNAVLQVFDPTSGETFTVCYGDFEERKNQLENWRTYVGKKLTVKYQTRYKDSKLPQFPTGVIIRDYE